MAQYESRKSAFSGLGVQAVFLAAQKREGIFHPEKYFAGQPGSFPFLLDEDRVVTKAYGVFYRVGLDAFHIAHPATFVIDRQGEVRFLYVGASQRDRLPLEAVLKIVARL